MELWTLVCVCIVCANNMVKMCVYWLGAWFVIDDYYVESVAEPSKQMWKGRRRRKQPQNKTKQNKKGKKGYVHVTKNNSIILMHKKRSSKHTRN